MSLREHGIIHIKAMPETDDDYKISPEFERQLRESARIVDEEMRAEELEAPKAKDRNASDPAPSAPGRDDQF